MRRGSMPRTLFVAALFFYAVGGAGAQEFLPPGHRAEPHGAHALTGARVVVAPGQVVENGVVLIRDGLIVAAGADLEIPTGMREWPMTGHTIYAGLIDCHLEFGKAKKDPREDGDDHGQR